MSTTQGTPPCPHTVQQDDTFSSLALAYYGDGSDAMAAKIANKNPDVDPKSLKIGQVLQIPAKSPHIPIHCS